MAQPRAGSHPDQASTSEGALVQGSLWKAIWSMSWPLLLTTVSTSIIGLVDMQVAGKLGSPQQAAVGLSEQVLFLFMVFIMSIGVGTNAMVSRAAGAGDTNEATEAAAQSLSLSVSIGLVLCVMSLLCARFGLQLFSQAPDVVSIATDYLSTYSFYLVPFSIAAIVHNSFRAIGDAKTPLLIVACTTVINIAGDYLTVLYNWPVPGLGLRGIPASGIFASTLGATLGIYFLSRSPLKGSLKRLLPVHMDYVKRILKVGIPSGLQRLGWSLSVFVLFFILTHCTYPTNAIAAWTIGMRVEALLFMPLMALSLAVSSIVGQNLGAKRLDRAVSAGWKVTGIGIALMCVLGTLMFVFAKELAGTMTQDAHTAEYVIAYLRINACSEPLLALTMILGGALQGAGDTRVPMLITVCSHWIVRLPLAYTLAILFKFGPSGAWASMAASCMVSATLTTLRFNSKAWANIKV